MSWQLGAFAILGVALAGGFAWYERARPDARVVALVATLAAFAALGRIAFAAVPNVKPTTDIVLISGYALGGGPGFAVGALAGLSSNFFFGQGPWTPWQMAAWGATGMVGAGLAWASGRRWRPGPPRIGRVALAVACGVVGFAFTAVQDVGDWVTYSDHSLAQLGAYVGQGLGFDALHCAGCVAFALAMGPALIRSVQRFARRLEVRWVAPGTAFPLLLALGLTAALAAGLRAPAAARADSGLQGPVSYLLGAENPDGGFGAAPGQASSGLFTGWAALGLAAAGQDPAAVTRGPHSVIDYVAAAAAGHLDTGSLERTILVLRAGGRSDGSLAGLISNLEDRRRGNGSIADQVNLTAFGILALRAGGVTPPGRMITWLARQQNRDRGFGFAGAGSSSDIDDTGAVLEALAGQPGPSRVLAHAVGYLRGRQDRDGGFPSQPGMSSNAQSTAWAVQGLDAVGVRPATLHRGGAVSPLAYLRSLITAGGSILYARGQGETPVWVTGEALMALAGKPLPLAPVPAPARRGAASRSRAPAVSGLTHTALGSRPRRHRGRPARPRAVLAPLSSRRVLELSARAGLIAAIVLAPIGLG